MNLTNLRKAADYLKKQHYWNKRTVYKKDIIEDIKALRRDFENVIVNGEGISAVTEPIKLGKRNFGRFRIVWNYSYDIYAYALEPSIRPIDVFLNKMTAAGYYHHPHVYKGNNSICTGDGEESIYSAYGNGRIHDLFLIANSILHGYNVRSAFASISSWGNTYKCPRCGERTKIAEDLYRCQECNVVACRNCMALICRDKDCRRGYCKRCALSYKYKHRHKPKDILCMDDHGKMKQVRPRRKKK